MRKSIIIALVLGCNSLAGLVRYLPPTDQNIPVILPSGAEVRIVGEHAEELVDYLTYENEHGNPAVIRESHHRQR